MTKALNTPIETKRDARDLVVSGDTKTAVAAAYGVSIRTLGRWIEDANASTVAKKAKPVKVKQAVMPKSTGVAGGYADGDAYRQPFNAPTIVEDDVEYRVLATRKSISLTRLVNSAVDSSVVIDRSADTFDEVFELIVNSGMAQDALEKAYFMCQPKKMVEGFTKGKFKVDVVKGSILYTPDVGVPFEVSGKLSQRIIDTIKNDGVEGVESLFNFLDKLMLNPSNRSVNELYGFLTHNDIEIAPNGNFYAWKVVRDTYFDVHSNTMDNSVGNEVRVARNQVNENSEVTCSYGLHVCAKSYIKHFSSNGNRVVKVEVHPQDVVAVPKDYNDSKMRCAGYNVVEDVTDAFSAEIRGSSW
jgi:hypothetical protein